MTNDIDIAIAHWNESCNGGGERVAWALARQFDAPLYVGRRDSSIEPDDVEVRELHDGLVGRAVDRGGLTEMVAQQLGWEIAAPLREFDTIITSGNEPLAYVPPPEQTWVHYVHHTSRRATDLLPAMVEETEYGRFGGPKHLAERLLRKVERQLYARYARKPDLLVANSDVIARRIRRYWGVGYDRLGVVYPPVPVGDYGPDLAETEDYYLSLSRLDWHKALGGVVEAFADTTLALKIAGDGSERDALESQAAGHDNIELLGYVDETEKRELLAGAKGFVVNAYAEDFGLTTVEALASGTPVLGVAEGMTQYLVRDGKTGYTYDRGTLREAVRRLEAGGVANSEREIADWTRRFTPERFGREMRACVEEARERSRVTVNWGEPDTTADAETVAITDGGDDGD